jgi:hypothetical protein
VPGKTPHPRRNPRGHSYGKPESRAETFTPEDWRKSQDYLYGIDLYNYGYWWECHEVFEALWHAAGHKSEPGNFFQALIQVAAANLKRSQGQMKAAQRLCHAGLARLKQVPPDYMGMQVAGFAGEVRRYFTGRREQPALIGLTRNEVR